MLGAIYIGLSGLNAYSQGLQTISNNVANLNTQGYKQNSLAFSDLFSTGGGGLTFQGGGVQQSGSGVRIGDPLIDFSQGQLSQTTNNLDFAIQGSGFLVLLNNGTTFYTRTGSFVVDKDGFISDQTTGFHLGVLNAANQPVALNINAKRTSPPAATTTISFADNLSSSATTATVSNINVFDSRGGQQVWTVTFTKATPPGTGGVTDSWTVTVTDASGKTVGTSTLNFIGSAVDPSTAKLTVTSNPTGANPLNVTLDFSAGVTSFSAGTASTIRAASVDGNAVGTLTGVTATQAGQIQLTYSNGKTELEGAVAIADIQDQQKLQRVGNGLYHDQGNGNVRLLASGTDGVGTLQSRELEASNVNLSNEFASLILIQRGFQASSQVISIANEMIQQLFGIRGQGQ